MKVVTFSRHTDRLNWREIPYWLTVAFDECSTGQGVFIYTNLLLKLGMLVTLWIMTSTPEWPCSTLPERREMIPSHLFPKRLQWHLTHPPLPSYKYYKGKSGKSFNWIYCSLSAQTPTQMEWWHHVIVKHSITTSSDLQSEHLDYPRLINFS